MASGISITALILAAIAIILAIVFIILGTTSNNTGPTGSPGQQGRQGPTGETGPPGSATNTGATGSMGPTGATGPTGQAGSNGLNGSIGATGPAGPQGSPGGNPTSSYGRMYIDTTIKLPEVNVNTPPSNPTSSNTPLLIRFPLSNVSGTTPSGCFFCTPSDSRDEFPVQPGKTYLFEYGASVTSSSGSTDWYIWLADLFAPHPTPPGWSGDSSTIYQNANYNPLPGSTICITRNTSIKGTPIPYTGSYTYTVPSSFPSPGLVGLVAATANDSNGSLATRSGQTLINGVSAFITVTQLT